MQIADLYQIYCQYPVISTDTRKIRPDSIFFALKGESFDGNLFADQALENGAKYAVIDDDAYQKDERYLLVEDVLVALQELARFHRKHLKIPVIGITGTNGKTTTKELLYSVLSEKYKTYATQGNLNNHIGVPLTILSIDSRYEMAILEMGANHMGEIAFLCAIAQPTHGLITNVGKAHLEGFGSFEGVKKTKGELYHYLASHQGTLFLQADNPHLAEMVAPYQMSRVVTYGFSADYVVSGQLVNADPYLSIAWRQQGDTVIKQARTNLTGSYNTENFLAAIAVGMYFGLSATEITHGVEKYVPQNNRSQITKTDKNTVIADFYNANASSMSAALDNMQVLQAENKVVILGDMFEMGDEAFEEHKNIITKAKKLTLDRLVFVGQEFFAQRDEDAEFYLTTEDAKAHLEDIKESFILLKASRGMSFEKLMDVL